MNRTFLACLVALVASSSVSAQEAAKPPTKAIVIKAGKLIDPRAGRVLTDRAILVRGERIEAVGPIDEVLKAAPKDCETIDLSGLDRPARPGRLSYSRVVAG